MKRPSKPILHYAFRKPLYFCLAASTSMNVLLCSAQENEVLPWYQVEVIVFENRSFSSLNPDSEAWPRDLLMAYPPRSQHLMTIEELKEQEALAEATLLESEGEDAIAATPQNDIQALNTEELADEQVQESPFIELGEEIYQLNREKLAIDAEHDMRVLFHKVWRQPLTDNDHAPNIILLGGNQYDGHYELEGTITLSVSRYLHVNTDLWFTHFEANVGQDDTWWPNLPAVPAKSTLFDEADSFELDESNDLATTPPPWFSDTNTSGFSFNQDYDGNNNDFGLNAIENNYVVKEIVKLAQSRRMRSGELHYIDHPKLGIVIRIDTYTLPTLSTELEP